MTCASPDDLARYWLGDLAPDDEAALEEHLFACDRCSGESERFAALARGIRHERRVRALPIGITRADWDALLADGLTVESIAARADAPSRLIFPGTTEVVVVRLELPEPAAASYALEITSPVLNHLVPSVPAERGEVLIACRNHFMIEPPQVVTFRLFEGPRLVGEYVVDHQRP
jgi:anti-sigma factor RsiW